MILRHTRTDVGHRRALGAARPLSQLTTQEMEDVASLGSASVWGFNELHRQAVLATATSPQLVVLVLAVLFVAAVAGRRKQRCHQPGVMV